MIRPALLAVLLVLSFPGLIRAQAVAEGVRVRVLASSISADWMTGTVESVDSAALRLRVPPAGATLVVPMERLQRLQAGRGRERATLQGAIVGGTLGALVGFFAIQTGEGGSCARGCGGASGGGFLIGAGIGTAAGALLGSRIRTGPERWRDVPIPPR